MVCSPSLVLPSLSTPGNCHPPFMQPQGLRASRVYHPSPACLFASLLTCLWRLADPWTISHGPRLIFSYSWTYPGSSSQVSEALCRIVPQFLPSLGAPSFLNCYQWPLVDSPCSFPFDFYPHSLFLRFHTCISPRPLLSIRLLAAHEPPAPGPVEAGGRWSCDTCSTWHREAHDLPGNWAFPFLCFARNSVNLGPWRFGRLPVVFEWVTAKQTNGKLRCSVGALAPLDLQELGKVHI